MSGTARSGKRTYSTGAVALGVAVGLTTALGIVTVWNSPPASAQPVSIKLNYTCAFTGIGTAQVTMSISTDIPSSLEAGDSSPRATVNGVATVDPSFTALAPLVGASTLEGSVDGTATVSAPEGDSRLSVPMTIPRTPIPAFGAFDMSAKGTAPAVTFTRPGNAKVTVGDLGLHLTPRDAFGNPTAVGTMNAACTVDPGQDRVLQSLVIKEPVKTTGPGTGAGGNGSGSSDGAAAGTGPGTARSSSGTTTTPSPSPSTTGSVPPRSPSPSPGAPTLDTPRDDPTGEPDDRHGDPDPKHPIALALGVLVPGMAAALVALCMHLRKRRADG
ncbi:hypothetical protein BN159_2109 [Streptomyces davaonensis JCM 4913]|uniref:DUF6801 domain-containing protein n=1 Tax=Streptomyces davaonensis (strain DSM 101723 / JCM 4913 / KCC S-0913 / 768) TaxID=1214101 RepID=K4QZI2_STRDJ|nr:DUF6801 domain-containing protein [Streptomyces davaonensis]CCK26488.1 hypothetical protein BN159_2109 [Streptomyces davaonensis JCM 4913]